MLINGMKRAAVMLAALVLNSSIFAAEQKVSVPADPGADVASAVSGTWNMEITVEKPKRYWEERRIQIQSVSRNSAGTYQFSGQYSWAGAANTTNAGGPITGEIVQTADGPTITFITAGHNKVTARWVDRDNFAGTLEMRFLGTKPLTPPVSLAVHMTKIRDPRKVIVPAASGLDPREMLKGAWSVSFANDATPRVWVVDSISEQEDEALAVSGQYGLGTSMIPVTAKIAMYDNGANLTFANSGGLSISAVWFAPTAIVGRFQYNGQSGTVRIIKRGLTTTKLITRNTKITVLFVSAYDCKYCRYWKVTEGRDFQASSDFNQVAYRMVEAGHFDDIGRDEDWPADLRHVRDQFHLSGGTPRFFLLLDDTVVGGAFGAADWTNSLLPRIHEAVRKKLAANN